MSESENIQEIKKPSEVPTPTDMLEYLVLKNQDVLQDRLKECDKYGKHSEIAIKVDEEHYDVVERSAGRVREASDQITNRLEEVESSATISSVYIKMKQEMQGKMSDKEFIDFFKSCIDINLKGRKLVEKTQDEFLRNNIIYQKSPLFVLFRR